VAEQFTGFKGKYVKLADTMQGASRRSATASTTIVPEQAFYMQGSGRGVAQPG
jgi:F-type H+/Na+-transporting ATPase subunit beta